MNVSRDSSGSYYLSMLTEETEYCLTQLIGLLVFLTLLSCAMSFNPVFLVVKSMILVEWV